MSLFPVAVHSSYCLLPYIVFIRSFSFLFFVPFFLLVPFSFFIFSFPLFLFNFDCWLVKTAKLVHLWQDFVLFHTNRIIPYSSSCTSLWATTHSHHAHSFSFHHLSLFCLFILHLEQTGVSSLLEPNGLNAYTSRTSKIILSLRLKIATAPFINTQKSIFIQ